VAIDAKRRTQNSGIITSISEVACDESSQWEIFTHGGRNPTGIDVVKWAQYMESLGAGELLLTSMDADGSKNGYDIDLYKSISNCTKIPIIASGGAGTLTHISDVLAVADAALLASMLHYKETSVELIKAHCKTQNICVR
jgi:cyclase